MKDWDYENEQWTQLPSHLKHLPLFTRDFDLMSMFIRLLWAWFLNLFFHTYIRLKVVGDFHKVYRENPRLIVISNHASHLDAISIAAAIPVRYWLSLYIAAAKDYFFTNPLFTFFSQHCLGAIPIDRTDKRGEAIKLCTSLLTNLKRIWLIIFPEGTRSKDGYLSEFKRGISVFSLRTNTPILFLYIDGNAELWPKSRWFAKMGKLTVYVGPVQQPAPIEEISKNYREWVMTITKKPFRPEELMKYESQDDQESQDLLLEE
jgi:1-acyl-sn-glycerol-3-phosphate acyltransferase